MGGESQNQSLHEDEVWREGNDNDNYNNDDNDDSGDDDCYDVDDDDDEEDDDDEVMVMVTKKREESEAARAAYSKPLPAGISDIACNYTFFYLLNSFFSPASQDLSDVTCN